MPIQVPTQFTAWEFTQAELYAATRFSQLQLMLIQTLIAQAAQRKVNLKYDPSDPLSFAQQEAEATGEISAYEWLMLLHTNTEVPSVEEEGTKADVSNPNVTAIPQSQPKG